MTDQPPISVQVAGDVKGELFVAGGSISVDRRTIYAGQPPSAIERADMRNRAVLLEKVHAFWVQGVLEKSLHGLARIELGLEERPGFVEHPWEMVLQTLDGQPQPIPPGTGMIDLFDKMTQAVLILGDPGSGKTTMLLDLTRSLLERSRNNVDSPIPVVFMLSSWTEKRLPLFEWLIDQLNAKYLVPKEAGRAWLEQQSLGLMLDGLDEVRLEARDDCVAAINAFRAEYGLTPICVSSRAAEYEMLTAPLQVEGAVITSDSPRKPLAGDGKPIQLKLDGALLLKPLTDDQISAYVQRAGPELAGLRRMLEKDSALRELAHSPLMLSIMMVACRGMTEAQMSHSSLEDHRKHLFDAYIKRMFQRKAGAAPYLLEETTQRLAWLAQKMQQSGQTMLLLEEMQPSWLTTAGQRRAYHLLQSLVGFPLLMLPFALIPAIIMIVLMATLIPQLYAQVGTPIELTTVMGMVAEAVPTVLSTAVLFGVIAAVVAGLIFGRGADQPIRVVDSVRWSPGWSWSAAVRGFVMPIAALVGIGLLSALNYMAQGTYPEMRLFAFGIFVYQTLLAGLFAGVFWALVSGVVFGGLSSNQVQTHTRPNEGIRKSLFNGLLVGGIAATSVGVIALGAGWLLITGGLLTEWWVIAISFAASLIAGITGYSLGLQFGGTAAIQHFALRMVLSRSKRLPLKLQPFLDHAAGHIFLRRVGGGYIFVHRLLMEHFAAMSPEQESAAPPQTAAPRSGWQRYARIGLGALFFLIGFGLALNGEVGWGLIAFVIGTGILGFFRYVTSRPMVIASGVLVVIGLVIIGVWVAFWHGDNWFRLQTHPLWVGQARWLSDGTLLVVGQTEVNEVDPETGTVTRRAQFQASAGYLTLTYPIITEDGTQAMLFPFNAPAKHLDVGTLAITEYDSLSNLLLFAWSPDGTEAVTDNCPPNACIVQSTIELTVLDTQTWQPTRTLTFDSGDPAVTILPQALFWSPDGRQIAVACEYINEDGTPTWRIVLIDAQTGDKQQEIVLEDYVGNIVSVEWSPDSTQIATAPYFASRLDIWDTTTGQRTAALTNPAMALTGHSAWSPDGRLIALGGINGPIFIGDVQTAQIVKVLYAHNADVLSLAWSASNYLVTADAGHYIVWNMDQEIEESNEQ